MSLAFLLTSLVIVVTPGTGALLTIAAGLRRGARSSLVTAFGCTLGTVPHLAAAITGTAALLHASGVAFDVVKFLGVGYLLWMAWSTWRDDGVLAMDDSRPPMSTARTISTAVVANLLNPKLTLFFFAFLPQFVPAGTAHPVLRMLALSGVFMALTLGVFSAYGVFAAAARTHLINRPRIVRRLQRAFSLTFVGLSAKLATTAR
jgi:threonine/homoserine/homoserine lactone efflux protein